MRALVTGALWGLGLGLAAGLADGRYAQVQSLSGDPGYLMAGLGLGAGLGLVVGAVSGLWVPWPSWKGAVVVIAAALGAPGWLPPVAPTIQPPAAAPHVGFERLRERLGFLPSHDLVVVLVPGLRDAVAAGDVPVWSERVPEALVWADPVASAPDPDLALLGALRFEHTSAEAATSLADLLALQSRSSRLLLSHDRASDALLSGGFGEVVPAAGLWNEGSTWFGALALPRALWGPRVVSPAEIARRGVAGLTTLPEDRPWVVVVQLSESDGVTLGLGLRVLFDELATTAPEADLLVVGLPASSASGLDRAGVGTLAALWTREEGFAGLTVRPPTPLAGVILAAVGGEAVREVGTAIGARPVPLKALAARRGDNAPEREGRMAMAAAGQDQALACMMLYPDAEGPAVLSRGAEGATVVRAGGYALWQRGDTQRLYDEVLDAAWTTDLLAGEAPTCGGVTATARAQALQVRGRALGRTVADGPG